MLTLAKRGRTLGFVLTTLWLGALGCTGELGLPAADDPLADVSDQSDPVTQQLTILRAAIYRGKGLGQDLLVGSVNQVLREDLLGFEIESMVEVPEPTPPAACPYVAALGNDPRTSVSCRFLVERGRDLAYGRVGAILEANPLDGAPYDEAEDRVALHTWYRKGTFSGVDGHVIRAASLLRIAGVCDAQPTPVRSSELAGVEVGRAIMQRAVADQEARTPRTQCDIDTGIIAPARSTAVGSVPAEIQSRPLCADGIGTTETDALLEFAEAKLAYEQGIRAGIEAEAVLQSQRLLDTWICIPPDSDGGGGTGDPLVVDLAGDGVAPIALADGVAFDLTGTGLVRQVGWPAGDDALLAIDLDASGAIESGRELFGNYTLGAGDLTLADGFAALAMWDHPARGGNLDGRIDAADAVWTRLLVWRDADRDGRSAPGELVGVAAAGLASLPLDAATARRPAGDALIVGAAGALHELWLPLAF